MRIRDDYDNNAKPQRLPDPGPARRPQGEVPSVCARVDQSVSQSVRKNGSSAPQFSEERGNLGQGDCKLPEAAGSRRRRLGDYRLSRQEIATFTRQRRREHVETIARRRAHTALHARERRLRPPVAMVLPHPTHPAHLKGPRSTPSSRSVMSPKSHAIVQVVLKDRTVLRKTTFLGRDDPVLSRTTYFVLFSNRCILQ